MHEIKQVALVKDVVMYSADLDEYFVNKKGVILVYDVDNNLRVLDLTFGLDITDLTNIEVCLKKGKSKVKVIFEKNEENEKKFVE